MSRHLASIVTLLLGLVAGVLVLALPLQWQLFENHRLHRLEMAQARVLAELRQGIEEQLKRNSLAATSRVLNRFVSLPTRDKLVSSILVQDASHQTVFEYTDPLIDAALPPQVDLRRWPEGWRRLAAVGDPARPAASLRSGEDLYVAAPLTLPDGRLAGLLVLGLKDAVSLRDFYLEEYSPALLALAFLFGAAALAAQVAWRLSRRQAWSRAMALQGLGDEHEGAMARLDRAADRLAQAQMALRRLTGAGRGGAS